MVSTLIPNDAPFEADKRRFVEGFVAGLITVRELHKRAAPPTENVDATPLLVLYGSQSGNSEALSKDLRKLGRASGFNPTVGELDSFDRASLVDVRHLLIVCSTFGEGDPPDNARRFTDWLMSDDAPQLPNLNYAVCALGDRLYTQFCKAGIDLDRRLSELGATRIADCVTCDVAYEDDYAGWKQAVFGSEIMTNTASDNVAIGEEEEPAAGPAVWGKSNPFPATLLQCERLSGDGSAKEVNHIELCLAGSGLSYSVGDALGLVPVNCCELVREVLATAGLRGDEVVQLKDDIYPIRSALMRKLDLCTLTPKVFETLKIDAPAEQTAGMHLLDLLYAFRPEVTAQQLAEALRPLQPRLYSISSSPKAHPGEVHLTVGAVRYQACGRSRKGVASTFLADRLFVGSTAGVYIQKAAHFHLPEDPSTPIIMVGPGTGIAPFRAFLEEREAVRAPGKSWLFFGDQHEASDFLYREQLLGMRDRGWLTRLDLAWSRDQGEKVYVQHKMLQAGAELWAWLNDGAHFYVCGDAARMAGDVDKALRTIAIEHGAMEAGAASAWIDELTRQGRYQRDVY